MTAINGLKKALTPPGRRNKSAAKPEIDIIGQPDTGLTSRGTRCHKVEIKVPTGGLLGSVMKILTLAWPGFWHCQWPTS